MALADKEKKDATRDQRVTVSQRDLISTGTLVRETHTPEIVIALCGPIGTPLHDVASMLEQMLSDVYGYTCRTLRLSKTIETHQGRAPSGAFERIEWLINQGNELRRAHGASILADLAIHEIALHREQAKAETTSPRYSGRRVCHIINSVKNAAELEALRLVYRDMFYSLGVFAPMEARERSLLNQGMSQAQVYQLVDRDSGEELKHGQTVRDVFPKCDCFVRTDLGAKNAIRTRLERFLKIVFGAGVLTPTSAESAMYHAASAAMNSACLSRQVGAAVTDKEGNILAVGWNDVPRFGGGLYGDTSADDHRCARWQEKCHNDEEKLLIAEEIAAELVSSGVLDESDRERAKKTIQDSRVGRLIEFSRAVHAEMHAILTASQHSGDRVRGGKLFCTTYPCHSCARHIILAGIAEVFYVEPYRKSLAIKLHGDAITEAEADDGQRVRILPYDGIAPRRFLQLFSARDGGRKRSGQLINIAPRNARPPYDVTLESIPTLEGVVVSKLPKILLEKAAEGHG